MVVAPLETERRPARPRDLGAACAAPSMRRKHNDVVGEREHAVAQGVVGRSREDFLELRTEQIDPRDVADEERAAGKEVLRIVGATQIRDERGDVLGRMPRRTYA